MKLQKYLAFFILLLGVPSLAATPEIPVNFTVLRNRLNEGNTDYVTRAYLRQVAAKASELTGNQVSFIVNRFSVLKNDNLYYQRDEYKILKSLESRSAYGYVNSIYSNDDTNNTGRALITGPCCSGINPTGNDNKYRYHPTIVFHSRVRDTSEKSINSAARLLLHELGHQIGFHHNYTTGALNGDNYYKSATGLKYLVAWAKKMQSFRPDTTATTTSPTTSPSTSESVSPVIDPNNWGSMLNYKLYLF